MLHRGGLEADASQQQVDPLVAGELAAPLDVLVEVETGKLDRLQVGNVERAALGPLFDGPELDVHDRPDPALQQALIPAVVVVGDMDLREVEVVHRRPVLGLARHEANLDAVDEPVPPLLLDHRLGLVGFVVAEVVVAQRLLDGIDPDPDLVLVVGCTVLPQQILQDVRRDVLATPDLMKEVLPDDLAGEYAGYLLIKGVSVHALLLSPSSRS